MADPEGKISLKTLWKEIKPAKISTKKLTNALKSLNWPALKPLCQHCLNKWVRLKLRLALQGTICGTLVLYLFAWRRTFPTLRIKCNIWRTKSGDQTLWSVSEVTWLFFLFPEIPGLENFPSSSIIKRALRKGDILSDRLTLKIIVAKFLNFKEK